MERRRTAAITAVAALFAVAACSSDGDAPQAGSALGNATITVASFDFAESRLLAELYSQALEAGGHRVERSFDLGPREFVLPSLVRGLVELVPEYTGTALQFASLGRPTPEPGLDTSHEALTVQLRDAPVTVLAPARAQNANAFVVTREVARRHDLRTLSDLAPIAPLLTFGGPPECPSRPLCLAGLERLYNISFGDVIALDAGGPLTHQALERGDVDAALLFTTDPVLVTAGVVELEDDRRLQPPENVVPLLHEDVVARFGDDVTERLDAVSARLTTSILRELNAEIDGGNDVARVAARWLQREGLR
jgi:osmoprotectant transport system substrate-binding protein